MTLTDAHKKLPAPALDVKSQGRAKLLAAVAAAIILPLAIVETIAAWRLPALVPTATDWANAGDKVRHDWLPGDLLVFAPSWLDQIGRSHLGDLMPIEMVGRADNDRYARIWVVGVRSAQAPDTANAALRARDAFGQLTVSLFAQPAATVKLDLVAAFDEARVSTLKHGDEKPCLADGVAARRCGANLIERRTAEVDYEPRRSILVPLEPDTSTRLDYDIELGTKLVVHVGLHDYYARKVADGIVDFRVLIDNVERVNIHHGNKDGWQRFELDTTPGKHAVRFEVSSKSPAWRIVAIAAEARN